MQPHHHRFNLTPTYHIEYFNEVLV